LCGSEDFVSTWQEPVFDVFGYFERSGEGRIGVVYKNSSGDEIANVNFFYNIAHVEARAYAH